METKIESTAATSATSRTDSEVAVVTKEQYEQEKKYLVTMNMAKKLLEKGVISDEEYRQIDTKFQQKYGVTFSTLFTTIDLI